MQAGPHGNQKDDYLHRADAGSGSILLWMGVYHYSECVSRVMRPPNTPRDQLRFPYFAASAQLRFPYPAEAGLS